MRFKRTLTLTFALLLSAGLLSGNTTYTLTSPQSDYLNTDEVEIGFQAYTVGGLEVVGHFHTFTGQFVSDGDKIENLSFSGVIQSNSLHTGNSIRDAHLKSRDFFDVETYPEILIRSTDITAGDYSATANAILTVRGISKPISFKLFFKEDLNPQTKKKAIRIGSSSIMFDRRQFGLTWNELGPFKEAIVQNNVKVFFKIRINEK